MRNGMQRSEVPVPDPTVITTEIINKEIRHLKEKLETRINGFGDAQEERMRRLEELFNERDRRHTERFAAQQLAVEIAFAASEKAITAAFIASEKAVEAAFKSSQEAITKSEVSIEKRADASYVSLTDLQRQLTALMPRAEAENRIGAISEKINRIESIGQSTVSREEYTARHGALQEALASLASRMDKQEGYTGGAQVDRSLQLMKTQLDANSMSISGGKGQKEGSNEQRNLMIAFAGFIATLIGIMIAVASFWPSTPGT